jgi:hypothetical protein
MHSGPSFFDEFTNAAFQKSEQQDSFFHLSIPASSFFAFASNSAWTSCIRESRSCFRTTKNIVAPVVRTDSTIVARMSHVFLEERPECSCLMRSRWDSVSMGASQLAERIMRVSIVSRSVRLLNRDARRCFLSTQAHDVFALWALVIDGLVATRHPLGILVAFAIRLWRRTGKAGLELSR